MTDHETNLPCDEASVEEIAARFAPAEPPFAARAEPPFAARADDVFAARADGRFPTLNRPNGPSLEERLAGLIASDLALGGAGPVVLEPKPAQRGVKHDGGKPSVWPGVFENFPKALRAVAVVSDQGQVKHPTYDDWKFVENGLTRYRNSLGRHLLAIADGETHDDESKLLHAAHAAWDALAVLELQLREAAK